MRYTTTIDITEYPEVWRNHNASRLYAYMVFRSGYHDDDRDIIRKSIRVLAAEADITVSACRHALAVLQRHKLLETVPNIGYKVTKFVLEQKPSKRVKTKQQERDQAIARERAMQQEAMEREIDERRRKAVPYPVYLELKKQGKI